MNIQNPRNKFIEELQEEIRNLKQIFPHIIISGYLNEGIISKELSNEIIEEERLINILEYKHMGYLPNTRNIGSEAIDHIWILETLLLFTKATGIPPFGSGFTSDHRPLFIDIALPQFISTQTIQQPNRILHSNNPKSVKTYKETLISLFKETKVEEKIT